MAKSPKHDKDYEPEEAPKVEYGAKTNPLPSGSDEPKPGSLEQRVARLEHEVNVLTPLAELLPMVTQLRRQYGGV